MPMRSRDVAIAAGVIAAAALVVWLATRLTGEDGAQPDPALELPVERALAREWSEADSRPVTVAAPPPASEASDVPSTEDPTPPEEPSDAEPRGSCHGRILFADDGSPIAAEIVWFFGPPHHVSRTNAAGEFRIENERVFDSPRSLMLGPEEAAVLIGRVHLRRGEDVEVEFRVERGFTLEVVATREGTSEPADGVRLWINSKAAEQTYPIGTTGADGRALFRHVPRAVFDLRATARGFAPLRRLLDFSQAEESERLEIEMAPSQPLTVVIDGWPTGRTAAIRVEFSSSATGSVVPSGEVGPDGIYRDDAPEPGLYERVTVLCDGWQEVLKDVEVIEREPVELRVKRPEGTRVTGVVVAPEGAPPPKGEIVLRQLEAGRSVRIERRGRIGEDGAFVIDLVPPLRYSVGIDLENGSQLAGAFGDISVPPEGLFDVVVRLAGGRIRGRVVGSSQHSFSIGASLVREAGGGAERIVWARARDDGRFEIPYAVPGRWRLSVSSDMTGYGDMAIVDVPPDGEADEVTLTWRLCPLTTFVVRRADGSPVVGEFGFTVREEGADALDLRAVFLPLDAEGRATVHRLPPGRFEIVGRDARAIAIFAIIEGENPPIEITLPD